MRGTYNPTRHGPKPALLHQAGPVADPVPAAVVDGLTGRGLRAVTQIYRTYANWTPQSLELLREVARRISRTDAAMTKKEREIIAAGIVDVVSKALAPLNDRIAAFEKQNGELRDRVLLLEADQATHAGR